MKWRVETTLSIVGIRRKLTATTSKLRKAQRVVTAPVLAHTTCQVEYSYQVDDEQNVQKEFEIALNGLFSEREQLDLHVNELQNTKLLLQNDHVATIQRLDAAQHDLERLKGSGIEARRAAVLEQARAMVFFSTIANARRFTVYQDQFNQSMQAEKGQSDNFIVVLTTHSAMFLQLHRAAATAAGRGDADPKRNRTV